jgi:hypothetical protein
MTILRTVLRKAVGMILLVSHAYMKFFPFMGSDRYMIIRPADVFVAHFLIAIALYIVMPLFTALWMFDKIVLLEYIFGVTVLVFAVALLEYIFCECSLFFSKKETHE